MTASRARTDDRASEVPDLSAARAVAASFVRSGALPAAVVGVSDAHQTLATFVVHGASGRPVSRESVFFLASVTKPIVATAVMQLVDEGRLDLHAPLVRVLPGYGGGLRDQVSAWHVLTHTSGLLDVPLDVLRRERPSYRQLAARIRAQEPAVEPGTRYAYASDPWYLLAEAIAGLTGMPFTEALSRRLLDRLGMAHTGFDPRRQRSRLTEVHGLRLHSRFMRELTFRFLARATLPGGGLFGTMEDLLRFGRALLPAPVGSDSTRVLSTWAIGEMTRDQTGGLPGVGSDGSPREVHVGLGWRLAPPGAPGFGSAFTHGGVTGTRIWVDPTQELAFVFLTNLWGAPDDAWTATLAQVYGAWAEARAT